MRSGYLVAANADPAGDRAAARRRAASFALAIVAHLLLFWLLLRLNPPAQRFVEVKPPSSFQLLPDAPADKPTPAPAAAHRAVAKVVRPKSGAAPHRTVAPVDAPAAAPTPPPVPRPVPTPAPSLFGNNDLFASADIGKLRSRADDAGAGDSSGSGSGKDSAAVYGPGEGPGGQRLYDVEWYREPTDAQLAFYMPRSGAPPGAWATVACRMIADYHVENCRALSESPVGSGLARAMRQAAWQFLVRPPRIGSRAQLGTWVRIRIDFSAAKPKP